MKKKPDLSSFKALAKDPTAFLDDASADRAEKPAEETRKPAAVAKLFRLSPDAAAAIKMDATQRSIATGRRVTETEIIEQLVRDHYKLSR
jgi:hypothetical protein